MEPYEGQEAYIFTSYARKDWERVKPFLDALSDAGYRVWYDAGIQAGADWLDTLLEKVENCAVFCPLFSEAFKDSRYCLFETAWAYQKTDKTIVSLYLDDLDKDNLGRFYQHLRKFQELRLHDLTPAQFVKRLESETAFAPCKIPEWQKTGQIQWRLSADGVLTIAKNEDMPYCYRRGSIPSYQWDPIHGSSTAPWAPYREKIHSVEIADNINAIGDNAFENCKRLTNVHIPACVNKIGDHAFRCCYCLTNLRIPDSVNQIGKWAFQNCFSLTNVHIPNRVTKIGNSAFNGCRRLTNVHIGDGVTQIGDHAFLHCKSLTYVRIPDSVTQIGKYAFAYCYSLDMRIPAHMSAIGKKAFLHCKSLTDIHIPDGVSVISSRTFEGCISLTNLSISDGVSKIYAHAFYGCENLKSVEIPIRAEIHKHAFPEYTCVIRRDAPQ